jgi:hypothetical protein
MLGTGGEMQQRFGERRPGDLAGQQQRAQPLGAGRAAGLARRQDGQAGGRQSLGQPALLRGFAGALPALDRDEAGGQLSYRSRNAPALPRRARAG